MTHWIY